MSEMLNYRESCELFIHDGRFSHRGGRYRGKGWLRWNPETGARIDIVAERTGPPLPKRIGFGFVGWLKPEHYTTIRMRTEGFDWVIAPHVGLVDRLDVILKSSLSIEVSRLICHNDWKQDPCPRFSGHVTLAFHERTKLFTPTEQTTTVGTRQVMSHSARTGLLAELDGIELCGHLDDRHRACIAWSAAKSNLVRERAWRFGYALRAALSLCAQCRAPVLERELLRDGHRYRELQPYRESSSLGYLGWFSSPFVGITADDCLRLALAFNNDELLLTMAWGVFSQLLDAQDQRAWGSSELLVATILEGMLRTLENKPFIPAGKRYNPQGPMKRLRCSHFPSVQAKQADRALDAHRRLRNRNAHPDWLEPDRHLTREVLTESSEDMVYLSRLYGRIIFEVAGLPEVAARIRLD